MRLLSPRRNNISILYLKRIPYSRPSGAFPHILVIKAMPAGWMWCEESRQFDALVAVSGEDHVNLLTTMIAMN